MSFDDLNDRLIRLEKIQFPPPAAQIEVNLSESSNIVGDTLNISGTVSPYKRGDNQSNVHVEIQTNECPCIGFYNFDIDVKPNGTYSEDILLSGVSGTLEWEKLGLKRSVNVLVKWEDARDNKDFFLNNP